MVKVVVDVMVALKIEMVLVVVLSVVVVLVALLLLVTVLVLEMCCFWKQGCGGGGHSGWACVVDLVGYIVGVVMVLPLVVVTKWGDLGEAAALNRG